MNKYKYIAKTALLHNGKRYPAESEILLTDEDAKPITAYLTLVEAAETDKQEIAVNTSIETQSEPDKQEIAVNTPIETQSEPKPDLVPDQPQDEGQKAEVDKPKRKPTSAK